MQIMAKIKISEENGENGEAARRTSKAA